MDPTTRITAALNRIERASEAVAHRLETARHQSEEKTALLKVLRTDIAGLLGDLDASQGGRNG